MTPIKPFHFEPKSDYALDVIFESWMLLTALIEASASILEQGGYDLVQARAAIDRGDHALVSALRCDRTMERMS